MKKNNLIYGSLYLLVYLIILYVLYVVETSHPGSNINSFVSAIWYSIVTLTTVGYGDYYPVTGAGRLISLIFILGSMGILGYLISQLNYKIQKYMEAKKYGFGGIKTKGHTIIFGLNKFSAQVMDEIISVGKQIVIVCNDKSELDILYDKYHNQKNLFLFYCEYDNYDHLNKINIETAECIYVSFLDDSESLVHILNIQSKFKNNKIIVNLNKPFLKETFRNAGVLFSISQEEIASKLIASYIFEPHAAEITEDLMASTDAQGKVDIQEYAIVEGNPFINKTYQESFLLLKQKYNSVLLGLYKKTSKTLFKNPENDMEIELGDRLIFLADSNKEHQIAKDFKVAQGY